MEDIKKIKVLVKEIQNLFFLKKYRVIIQETRKALKIYPKVSIFYNMLGLALNMMGKFEESKVILEEGLKINKDDLAIINNLANAYKGIFNYKKSEELYKSSISKDEKYIQAYVNFGNLKRDLNLFNEAITLYKKALSYNENISAINYSLALAYQEIGRFKDAENYALKTVTLDKKFTKADLLISKSKKYVREDEHFFQINNKLNEEGLNDFQKIDLNFALGKAYEDLKEIDLSFKFIARGNELKRRNIDFDIKNEQKKFKSIKDIFLRFNYKKFENKKKDNKNIIFIVGMPRSGTTLIEQIISSHSKTYGSGELPYLPAIINDEFIDFPVLSNEKFKKLLDNKDYLSEISEKYYNYLENYRTSLKYITDKNPLNFLWIGFIKILFPNAKIIHCKRNPKDNCVSLYKNIFEGNLNFCYTQNELAIYYNLYKDLMTFWQKSSSDMFLDVEYEKLILNPKNEVKKMLDYCELMWEDKCLKFSENKTPIKTASVGQARKNIYSTSVKSFLKYEKHLGELFNNI